MAKQAFLALALFIAVVGQSGCERLPQDADFEHLALVDFTAGGAIPAEYGRLVGVTSSETYPGWAQLWFERADSSIVTVIVNYQDGSVRPRILEIPRS